MSDRFELALRLASDPDVDYMIIESFVIPRVGELITHPLHEEEYKVVSIIHQLKERVYSNDIVEYIFLIVEQLK